MKISKVRKTCALLSAFSALWWTVTLSAGNLLPNGDFRKNLDGWKIAKWQKETAVSAEDGILRMRRDTLPESGCAVESGKIPVTPGTEYRLSAEMRYRKGEKGRSYLLVKFFDADGKRIVRHTIFPISKDTGGKFLYDNASLKSPEWAACAMISCYIVGCGEAEFRDLYFAEAKLEFRPDNLIPDADFQLDGGRFRNWHPLAWAGETEMKAGERSLILRRTEDAKRGGAAAGHDFAVKGGHEYAIAAEMRIAAEKGSRSYLLVEFFDASGKMILRRTMLERGAGTKGIFRRFSDKISAPAEAVAARLCCCLVGLGETEFRDLYFAEAKLEFRPGNLIPDADFQAERGRFRNWHQLAWAGETEMKAGERSLILRRTEDAKCGGAAAGHNFAVKGGHEYAVAVEMRIAAEKGFRSYLLVEFFDASGKMILRRTMLERGAGTRGVFRRFSDKISAPEKAVAARLCCCLVGLGETEFRNPFFGEAADLPKTDVRAFLPGPDTSGNDFPNAGFRKTGSDGMPLHWSIMKDWSTAGLYSYSLKDGALIIDGGRDRNSAGGIACDEFPLDGGKYYHFSAQIQNTGVIGHGDITLYFFDEGGKALSAITGVSQWNSDSAFYRQHHVFRAPKNCAMVRVLCALRGKGRSEFRDLCITSETPDYSGNPACPGLVLNSSFEEADFNPDFIDCFEVVSGGAVRSAEADHGFHALKLLPGSTVSYGKSARPISVEGNKVFHVHLAAKGKGSADFKMTFVTADGKSAGTFSRKVAGGDRYRAENFTVKTPDSAAFAALALSNSSPAPVTVDSLYLGAEPFSANLLPPPVPTVDRVVPHPEAKALPVSEVRDFQGIPTWHIDGKPVVNSLYTFRIFPGALQKSVDYHRNVARAGNFPIFVVGGPINIDETGPGSIDEALEAADFQIRLTLSAVPDARFLLWTQQYPSRAFAKKYPGELGVVEDPDQGFEKKIPGYSYGSEIWGRLCARSLEIFIDTLRRRSYGDRIVAVMPGFGNFGENNYGHIDGKRYLSPHDFSPAMTNFFRKYLFLNIYGGDAGTLSLAWGRKNFNFTDATVPTLLQREPRRIGGFPDPASQRQTIDYARCESFAILHRVLQQCRALKEYSGGRLLLASEIGYLFGRYNHREMMPMMSSRDIDAFGPAPGYTNRGPGDDIPDNAPSASLRMHNKIMLFQSDVRSHRTGDVRKRFGDTDNADQSVAVYLREIGKYLITGSLPYHWTFGMWYDDPKIMEVVKKFNYFMELSARFPRRSVNEIAVCMDPLSLSVDVGYTYREYWPTAAGKLYLNRSLEWHRLGANYDLLLLDDLLDSPDLKQYKVVILDGICALSTEQREKIRTRLCRDGRTVIWMFAPGVFLADGPQLKYDESLSSISGFRLEKQDGPIKLGIALTSDALKSLGLPENYGIAGNMRDAIYGGFIGFNPKKHTVQPPEEFLVRYRVRPDKDIVVFGNYADGGGIAAAMRKTPDCTSVYWGSSICDSRVMRGLVKNAGVHLYTDKPAVVYAGSNFLMVHVREAGSYRITLPRRAEIVRDLFTGAEVAANTAEFDFQFPEKGTLLAYFGDKSSIDHAEKAVKTALADRRKRNEAARPAFACEFQPKKALVADTGKRYPLAKGGFISDWLFLGPFPRYFSPDGFDADLLGGEKEFIPVAGMKHCADFDALGDEHRKECAQWFRGKPSREKLEICWTPYNFPTATQKNIGNFIPLRFHERIVYYVACTVICPEDREALIAIGSDDGHKAFLNGEPVNRFPPLSSRSMEPDSDMAPVKLRRGRNRLLLKVAQGSGGFGHAVRFLNPKTLSPLDDLKIELKP